MIVSNTTPLSNFLHLNRLDLVQLLFPKLHIPQAVHAEIDAYFAGHAAWKRAIASGVIHCL